MESLYHEHAYFITLTYCDEYLPVNPNGVNLLTGEVREVSTLNKKDLQNFLKRLREKFESFEEFDVRTLNHQDPWVMSPF